MKGLRNMYVETKNGYYMKWWLVNCLGRNFGGGIIFKGSYRSRLQACETS
jgi:hypothetical protein